jgi:hypothetical protein
MELFGTIGTWFGFVGACVVGPNAACIPFLAFFVLAVAAGAAMWLIARAYRNLNGGDEASAEERRERLRKLREEQRMQREVAAHVQPRRGAHRGWRLPA